MSKTLSNTLCTTTFGEMMKEALAIKTQREADTWLKNEVADMKKAHPDWSSAKCADTVRQNLGYMAGYYNKSASLHVKKFFSADHPMFGEPSYWDTVTSKEAFNMGKALARGEELTKK